MARLAAEAHLIEDGEALEVLVRNLRPGARVTAVHLLGPGGRLAGTGEIRHRRREIGGSARPGVGLEGSSSRGVGLSIDLVWPPGRYVDRPAETTGFAEARLVLPDPAAFAAAPQDFELEVLYLDSQGESGRLLLPGLRIGR